MRRLFYLFLALFILSPILSSCRVDKCITDSNSKDCYCALHPFDEVCKKKSAKAPKESKDILQDKLNTYGRYLAYYIHKTILIPQGLPKFSIGVNNIQNESGNTALPEYTKGFFIQAAKYMFSSNIGNRYIQIIDLSLLKDPNSNDSIVIQKMLPTILYYLDAQVSAMDKVLEKGLDVNLDATVGKYSTEATPSVFLSANQKLTYYELVLEVKDFNTNEVIVSEAANVQVPSKSTSAGFSIFFIRQGFNLGYNLSIEPVKTEILRLLTEFTLMTSFSKIFGTPYWHCFNSKKYPEKFKEYIHEMWINTPEDKSAIKKQIIYNYVYFNNRERDLLRYKDKELYRKVGGKEFFIDENIIPTLKENEIDRILIRLCKAKNISGCEFINTDFDTFWELYDGSPFCNYPIPKREELLAIKNAIEEIRLERIRKHMPKLYKNR